MKTNATRFFLAAAMIVWSCLSAAYAAPHYAILVDAGSSGSRFHLFQYESTLSLPNIQPILTKKISPGLSSFAAQPEKAAESLKPLLDEVSQVLSQHSVDAKTVSLHILATGGMRALPLAQQEKMYAQIRDALKAHYDFLIGDIKTIDGQEEGLYGWLVVNYLKGTFHRKNAPVGSIDLGGASMQIAYATKDSTPSPNKIRLVIDGQPYWVFSKSFLHLGQDRVREAMHGYPGSVHCYPKAHVMNSNRIGSFEMVSCQRIYSDILQKYALKQQRILPPKEMPFVAYSGAYYAYDFFNKASAQKNLQQGVQAVCHQDWNALQKAYPQDPYLPSHCANGTYIHELLFHAYQLQPAQVIFANKIQQQEISWTLGALLYRLVQPGSRYVSFTPHQHPIP